MRRLSGEHFIQVVLATPEASSWRTPVQKGLSHSSSPESNTYGNVVTWTRGEMRRGPQGGEVRGDWKQGEDQFHFYIPVTTSTHHLIIQNTSNKKKKKELVAKTILYIHQIPFYLVVPAYIRRSHFPASLALRLGLCDWVLTKEMWAEALYIPPRTDHKNPSVIFHTLSSSSVANCRSRVTKMTPFQDGWSLDPWISYWRRATKERKRTGIRRWPIVSSHWGYGVSLLLRLSPTQPD